MRILGLDVATTTGWCLLEDGKIKDFGFIKCSPKFTLPQKLNYYYLEVTRLIDRLKPDEIAIEDVILAISGPKTLIYLARLNGVVIQACFANCGSNVHLYTPSEWKKSSIPNICGSSPKWKIVLEVCNFFNIKYSGNFDNLISEKEGLVQNLVDSNKSIREEINKLKKENVRKKNKIDQEQRSMNENKINKYETTLKSKKLELSTLKKQVNKDLMSVSTELLAQTGITSDIADSICIAYNLYKIKTKG